MVRSPSARGEDPAAPKPRTTPELIADAVEALHHGDYEQAAGRFDAARKNPDFLAAKPPLELILAAGDHHFAQGGREEQDQAIAVYGLALDVYGGGLDPLDAATVRVRRVEVLGRQGRLEPARDEIAAIRQNPALRDNRRAQLMADLAQADLHLAQAQGDAARDGLIPLAEADDPVVTPLALFSLGRAYVQLNEPEEAVAAFRKLWNRYGESDFVKRAVFIAGQVYFDRGDFLEARKLYEACAVVGAATQTRVRPGDELVIKVSDRDYFIKTRSPYLSVTAVAPSGDRETLRLEKNQVSDQLYVGRLPTALAEPRPEDGTLQVLGSDTVDVSYSAGTVVRSFKVMVVDDGTIDIAGAPLPAPKPRHEPTETLAGAKAHQAAPQGPPPVVPTGTTGADVINPGSPVYVQVVDADLDTSDKADRLTVQVAARDAKGDQPLSKVQVTLTETGPHTGVFAGSVRTAPARPLLSAGSEAAGHPAIDAVALDTSAPAAPDRFWAAKEGGRSWIQIDLRRPAALGKLTWSASPDGSAARGIPTNLQVVLKGGAAAAAEKRIAVDNTASKSSGNVVDLGGAMAQVIRIEIDKFTGRAPSLSKILLTDSAGRPILPAAEGVEAADPARPEGRDDVLLFDVGQTVSASYLDEKNETPGIPTLRHSRSLGAGYHDGTVGLARVTGGPDAEPGAKPEAPSMQLHAAWRLDRAATYQVVVRDPDVDRTTDPDTLDVEVFTERGGHRALKLTETGPATGVFAAPLPLGNDPKRDGERRDGENLLALQPGELLWVSYPDEKNLNPGRRVSRYAWAMENRPTAGEFLTMPLVASAWPYQVKPADDGTMRIVAPAAGSGRAVIALRDPDAVPDASPKIAVKAQALIGGASTSLKLSPATGDGTASTSLDLILGDKDPEPRADPSDASAVASAAAPEINVAGDDVLRFAYADDTVATADSRQRPVMTEQQIAEQTGSRGADPADAAAAAVPTIVLRDPQRRIAADQAARLEELKAELGRRLVGYKAELELAGQSLHLAKARLAKSEPASKPVAATNPGQPAEQTPAARALAGLEAHVALLKGRIDRLTTLGANSGAAQAGQRLPAFGAALAVPDEAIGDDTASAEASGEHGKDPAAPSAPATAEKSDPAAAIADGPLVPGKPFDLVVDDLDLAGDTLAVRVRSLAGRLVDRRTVTATRDAKGVYRARVETRAAESAEPTEAADDADPGALRLVPGGEVLVDYDDDRQVPPKHVERVAYLALASDAKLSAMNASYFEPVSKVRLGEPVYLQVTDYDADRSAGADQLTVVVRCDRGDTLLVTLAETEPHSGVFRGRFVTDNGPAVADDDVLRASYGGTIEVAYHDVLRASAASPEWKVVRLRVMGGTDGTVEAFARRFDDPRQELQLWYKTGQAAYEVGRRLYTAGSLARAEQYLGEATDDFTQLSRAAPDDPLSASANYYLGNILALKGNNQEALDRYREVVARWPKSDFTPRARFKIGQCYEQLGQFDAAADAYVLLTYHHPRDPQVPAAMVRMMNHFARRRQWPDAVAVAQKFVEKFPQHEQAGPAAVKAGQWLVADSSPEKAVAWFVSAEKTFAKNDKDMPALLYWHAATLIQSKGAVGARGPEKIRELLNRVAYDYPASPFASLARGALEQMTMQN